VQRAAIPDGPLLRWHGLPARDGAVDTPKNHGLEARATSVRKPGIPFLAWHAPPVGSYSFLTRMLRNQAGDPWSERQMKPFRRRHDSSGCSSKFTSWICTPFSVAW